MSAASGSPKVGTAGKDRDRLVHFEVSSKTIVVLVLVVASIWLLIRLWPVLLVVVIALLIAGTLSPAVRWLEGKRVRRGFGIALVFTAFFVLTLIVVVYTIPMLVTQAIALLEHAPALRERIGEYIAGFHLSSPIVNWLHGLKTEALAGATGAKAYSFSLTAFAAVAYGLSAVFLALYIMIDRDRLRGGLFAVVPRTHHIRLSRVMMNLETIVGAYFRGQMITSLLMSIFVFALLSICGVENALALAVFAGLADLLPYIGPILSVGPAVLAAWSQGPVIAVVVLILMSAYEELETRVLIPRIYGQVMRLPSSIVLFALLTGGTLMGILGALLALPAAATVMMLIEELRVELPGEQSLLDDKRQRKADDRGEEEYVRRTEGVDAEEAAAIALEITYDRLEKEGPPPERVKTTIEKRTVSGQKRSTIHTDKKGGKE